MRILLLALALAGCAKKAAPANTTPGAAAAGPAAGPTTPAADTKATEDAPAPPAGGGGTRGPTHASGDPCEGGQ